MMDEALKDDAVFAVPSRELLKRYKLLVSGSGTGGGDVASVDGEMATWLNKQADQHESFNQGDDPFAAVLERSPVQGTKQALRDMVDAVTSLFAALKSVVRRQTGAAAAQGHGRGRAADAACTVEVAMRQIFQCDARLRAAKAALCKHEERQRQVESVREKVAAANTQLSGLMETLQTIEGNLSGLVSDLRTKKRRMAAAQKHPIHPRTAVDYAALITPHASGPPLLPNGERAPPSIHHQPPCPQDGHMRLSVLHKSVKIPARFQPGGDRNKAKRRRTASTSSSLLASPPPGLVSPAAVGKSDASAGVGVEKFKLEDGDGEGVGDSGGEPQPPPLPGAATTTGVGGNGGGVDDDGEDDSDDSDSDNEWD